MGQIKQNKIDDDFSKELSQHADELVAEMCQHTAPPNYSYTNSSNAYTIMPEKELSQELLNYVLIGFEALVVDDTQLAFDNAENIMRYAMDEIELLKEHDCHLSQDSGCETCEKIMELEWLARRGESLMIAIDKKTKGSA